MTEGDKAFYKRRIREELTKATAVGNRHLRQLHVRWALLYQERLDGLSKNTMQTLEARLRDAGYDIEQMAASEEQTDHRHAA